MNIDVIVAWPRNCDYPLWRLFLKENHQRFNATYIIFTETNDDFDYRKFVSGQLTPLDKVWVMESPEIKAGEDWRNVAICRALRFSRSPWVWFTEQDFEIKGNFFEEVEKKAREGFKIIGAYQDNRLHPCCIFMERDTLIKFTLDFGIVPNQLDHFGLIQQQIEERQLPVARIAEDLYFHYNGLSHNWILVSKGEQPNYQPAEFIAYLESCLEAPVKLDPTFKEIAQKAISAYKAQNL